jgi:hypothetical protein
VACGTGKTPTASFINEKLAAERTLGAVAVSPNAARWTANTKAGFDFLPPTCEINRPLSRGHAGRRLPSTCAVVHKHVQTVIVGQMVTGAGSPQQVSVARSSLPTEPLCCAARPICELRWRAVGAS